MKIHIIWAQDNEGGIGKNGKLPWHISEDLINFKKITLNSTIIMGRITWESLSLKPLPKRRNIVLSRNKIHNVECYTSIEKCINKLQIEKIKKVFIIGGSTIYKNFIQKADELHITITNQKINNIDTFFPITISNLKQNFKQISKYKLTHNTSYSHWIKK